MNCYCVSSVVETLLVSFIRIKCLIFLVLVFFTRNLPHSVIRSGPKNYFRGRDIIGYYENPPPRPHHQTPHQSGNGFVILLLYHLLRTASSDSL